VNVKKKRKKEGRKKRRKQEMVKKTMTQMKKKKKIKVKDLGKIFIENYLIFLIKKLLNQDSKIMNLLLEY